MSERNLQGYGGNPPDVTWPDGARVAVSFVVNVEEGAELSLADGDERNEHLYEINEEVVGAQDLCMTSHFGYGTRSGYQRIAEILSRHRVPATFSCCGRSGESNPWLIRDAAASGHEISCHGWRWERHAGMTEEQECKTIAKTHAALAKLAGTAPVGWHTRSSATPNTRRLLVAHGGFAYDSDAYDDDIPYVERIGKRDHVVLPYAFDTNDMRFTPGGGFVHGDDMVRYCLAAYDQLLHEGKAHPRMMSIGLHLRLIGRPGRVAALDALISAICDRGGAWFARRRDIAAHWRAAVGLAEWHPAGPEA